MARAMKDSGIEWIGEIPEGWKVYNIRREFSFGKGLPITKEDLRDSGEPVISYGQIHSKINTGTTIKPALVRYVEGKYLDTHPDSLAHKGDLIVADTSEDVAGCGNCIYVDTDAQVFAGYHTIILRNKTNHNQRYLSYLFQTDAWRSQIRKQVTGVKLFSISQKILRSTSVIIPQYEEQQRISDFLDTECARIDAVIEQTRASIEEYKKLKQSLITQAVTKGIRPGRKMKDSGAEWIGVVPEEWAVTKLKYFSSIRSGITLGKTYPRDTKLVEYPYLRVANVQGSYTDLTDVATILVTEEEAEKYRLHDGELLMTEGGDRDKLGRGTVWHAEIDPCLHQNHVFALTTNDDLSAEYVSFLSSSLVGRDYFDVTANQSVHLASTNSTTIMNFTIPVPSIEEQNEIVSYLTVKSADLEKLIAKKQTLIFALESYKKTLIFEYVTGKKEVV